MKDAAWERAPASRFTRSEGSQGSAEATLRALHTEIHLYLVFQWPDKTESLKRFYEDEVQLTGSGPFY